MPVSINGTSGITFNNSSTSTVGGLGDGQTWQNVTGSRAFGVTYTNSTGKPIFVSIMGVNGGGNGNKIISIYVNGLNVVFNGSYSQTGNSYPSGSAIVPNGSTYSADATGSSVSVTLAQWNELR